MERSNKIIHVKALKYMDIIKTINREPVEWECEKKNEVEIEGILLDSFHTSFSLTSKLVRVIPGAVTATCKVWGKRKSVRRYCPSDFKERS